MIFNPTIMSIMSYPVGNPFGLPMHGGVLTPPCLDQVLIWWRGLVENDTYLKDSATVLGNFPFEIVDGPCITLDGGSSKGTTVIDHGSIVSYEGTSLLTYDGADLTGTAGIFYNLLFADGTHYPCIGKTHAVNPNTIYATNGSAMVLIGTPSELWSGFQDTYFYEVQFGYWEDSEGRYPVYIEDALGSLAVNPDGSPTVNPDGSRTINPESY